MIEYSKQESEIFGVSFGRLNIDEGFAGWDALQQEIEGSDCQYIRVKIQNPKSFELEQLKTPRSKAHLLEILRVYKSYDLLTNPIDEVTHGFSFKKVESSDIRFIETLLGETYDDIPFGNYTPPSLLLTFPQATQLKAIGKYFEQNYTGSNRDKTGYIIYDEQGNEAGCFFTDYLVNSTYTYYVGIKKEYRNKQVFFIVINFIYRLTRQSNLSFGEGSARLTNLYSQQALEKSRMKCVRHDWIFLIEKK